MAGIDGERNLRRGTENLFPSIVVTVLTKPYPPGSQKLWFKWEGETLRVSALDHARIKHFVRSEKVPVGGHVETIIEDASKNTIRLRYRLGEVKS